MLDQKVLLVFIIISLLAVFGVALWRIVYTVKHKEDEKVLSAITKAKAFSSSTLWGWLLFWWVVSSFIFKADAVLTAGNVRTVVFLMVGVQCIAELIGAYYYTKSEEL